MRNHLLLLICVFTAVRVYVVLVLCMFPTDDFDNMFNDSSDESDGFFYEENFTAEEVGSFRITVPGQNWYNYDWDILGPLQQRITADPLSSKYAWTAVMMYMLSHYDYVHD